MPTSDYTPTLVPVGALLRTRTRDTNGNELGTFTANTRPTDGQVTELINTAVGDLSTAVGSDLAPEFHSSARAAAAYRAAMLVEISYFPEQVAAGRSPFEQLRQLWLDALKALRIAVEEAGTDIPGTEGSDPRSAYAFPVGPSSVDAVLGLPVGGVGGYVVPWSGGLYQ